MSRNKPVRKQAPKATAASQSKKTKNKFYHKAPKLPLFLAVFIAMWAFLWVWYGDMLEVGEQRSFFSFDPVAMQYYTAQPLGWLYVTGRFMLLSCKWAASGSLLLSLMLTLSAWLLSSALRLRGWASVLSVALPFAYLGFVFYEGLNLVYLRELSWIMTVPLIMLAACLLLAVVMLLAKRRRISPKTLWQQAEADKPQQLWGVLGVMAALFAGSIAIAETYAQNDRLSCTLETQMYQEDWDAMVKTAKSARQPSRTVAVFHAIALNQNGQAANELFNLPYQYRNAHLTRQNGTFDGGIDFIVLYANYYAGLTRPAYHESMEQMVLEGPSINKLKIMTKCALVDGESALAEKYLAILERVPFESAFCERYGAMVKNPQLVAQDQEMASVIELQPVSDTFEQKYQEPLFLGYNVALKEAKTVRGLYNSLYACLYSKDMPAFGQRVLTMIEGKMPLSKNLEEAIIVMNIKNLSVLKQLRLSQTSLQGMKDFMTDCFPPEDKPDHQLSREESNERSKEKGRKFRDKWQGTYQFYYYFQNIPDENYVVPGEDGEKGGVN